MLHVCSTVPDCLFTHCSTANEVMISPTYVDFTSSTTQVSVTIGGIPDTEPELTEMVTISFTTASANVEALEYTITVIDATGEGPTVLCVSVDMCTVRLFPSNYIL